MDDHASERRGLGAGAASDRIDALRERLRDAAPDLDRSGSWPVDQLGWCAEAGVYRWFVPREYGGDAWSDREIIDGYLALSQGCLTTAFVLTQWNAACQRIAASANEGLKSELLPRMARGELFATVGISHLSTSRQYAARPVLAAQPSADGGWILDGYSPWVTGGAAADCIVTGATLDDGRQLLAVVPTDRPGVTAHPGQSLVALTASCTDRVDLDRVHVSADEVIAGPVAHVMQSGASGGTGGLSTSTLAIGLTLAAVGVLGEEAARRDDLRPIFEKLDADARRLQAELTGLAQGRQGMELGELRRQANSLALRSTQAALSAVKGAGFLAGHPAGRMAREALFFLVWSCPQPVVNANLCEFAQLADRG